MLATWWLGIALELQFHLMHAIPLLQRTPVFLVGDSLSAGIGGDIETWPKRLARSHHVVFHDLSRSGADTATAMRQAEQVNGSTSLVLVEIGGNDVLRATRPDAFEQALDVLLAKLRDVAAQSSCSNFHCRRFIIDMAIPNAGWPRDTGCFSSRNEC